MNSEQERDEGVGEPFVVLLAQHPAQTPQGHAEPLEFFIADPIGGSLRPRRSRCCHLDLLAPGVLSLSNLQPNVAAARALLKASTTTTLHGYISSVAVPACGVQGGLQDSVEQRPGARRSGCSPRPRQRLGPDPRRHSTGGAI